MRKKKKARHNRGKRYSYPISYKIISVDSDNTLFIPSEFDQDAYNFLSHLSLLLEEKIFRMEVNEFTSPDINLIEAYKNRFPQGKKLIIEEKDKREELIDEIAQKHSFEKDEEETLGTYLVTNEILPSGHPPLLKEEQKHRNTRIWDGVSKVRKIAWLRREGKSYKEILKIQGLSATQSNINATKKLLSNAYARRGMEKLKEFIRE